MGTVQGSRLAGVALCVVALGSAALAAATTKTSSGTVDHETRTFTAKCPKGERVEVGGFRTTVNEVSGTLVEDLTFTGGRRWKATFDGLGAPAQAAAIAYCAKTPGLIKRTGSDTAPETPRHRTRRGPGFEFPLAAIAKCPKGTSVQLGGFTVRDGAVLPRGGPSSGFRPASMEAITARRWRVSGVAVFPGVQLTAVAGCADLPAPDAVEKTKTAEGGFATTVRAKCPQGKKVVLGGFKRTLVGGGGPYIRLLKRPTRRVWKASTTDFGDLGKLTAIAYCG